MIRSRPRYLPLPPLPTFAQLLQAGGAAPLAFLMLSGAISAAGECLVDNPGGSKTNFNRPADADTPAAAFSPISYLNKALPTWVCFTAGYRTRVESYSAGNFVPGNSDTYLLTRFRFGAAFKPASWFKSYVELQDADAFWKAPPLGPPYQSTWDLRRAYADFGDVDEGPIAVRVGRQDLSFGNQRLVGTSYWRNASKGWDAAIANINLKWLKLSTFAASPVLVRENGLSHHQAGNNLHGIYGTLKRLLPGSRVEPYLLWRLSPNFKTETGPPAKLNEKTLGLRLAGRVSGFDYDVESARQFGHIASDPIRAWAWTAVAGYTFQSAPLRPRIFAGYAFASGDRNPTDGVHGTFDQIYPNIHDSLGLADQIAWQNLKSVRAGIRAALRRSWFAAGVYNDWWLASANDAFYSSSGTLVARDMKGLSGTHVGREYDVQTTYRVDRSLEFGVGLGYIRSGDFLLHTRHAASYTYPYVMLNYNVF